MRTVLIYVVSAVAIWFAIRFTNHIERYELLQTSGIRTTGKVISTTCGNHGSFTYEYTAQGRNEVGYGKSSDGGLSCDDLAPGRSIPVEYLSASPAESVAGSAASALSAERSFAAISALLFPAIVLWLVRRKKTQDDVA